MRKLTAVFFDAGGGHRNAAEALKSTLESHEHPWDVTLLNLQELLDPIDSFRRLTGLRLQDAYNVILRKGWTRLTPELLVTLRAFLRLHHRRVVGILEDYWLAHPADLVLSVVPHFNRAIPQSMRTSLPGVPFVTLLTDFADSPPHFWIERDSEYLLCGTERACQQAAAMGHPADHLFSVSGMVLKPRFYQKPGVERIPALHELGLNPALPTGIVLFGGHGAPVMKQIVRRLDEAAVPVQLILICGHNTKLMAAIRELQPRLPIFIEGFTSRVDHYMALADFFIGKPGPGSISEALQFHLPVIVERNARTMPQERYNTEWLEEKKMGIVVPDFKEIVGGVQRLLEPASFDELRRNARAYSNRALFEIPEILARIASRHPGSTPFPEETNPSLQAAAR